MKNVSIIFLIYAFLFNYSLEAFFSESEIYKDYEKGKYDDAIQKLVAKQVKDPFDSEINYNLGVANYSKKQFEDAKKSFKLAFEHASSKEIKQPALFNLARSDQENALLKLGENWMSKDVPMETLDSALVDVKDAIAHFEDFIQNDPENELAKNFLKQAKDLLEAILKKKEMDKDQNKQDQNNKNKQNENQKKNQNKKDQSKEDNNNRPNKDDGQSSQKQDQNNQGQNQQNQDQKDQKGSTNKEDLDQDKQKEDKNNSGKNENQNNESNNSEDPQQKKGKEDKPNEDSPSRGDQKNEDDNKKENENSNELDKKKEEDQKNVGGSNDKSDKDKEALSAKKDQQGKDGGGEQKIDQSLAIAKSLLDRAEQKESKLQKGFLVRNLKSNKNLKNRW